MREFFRGWKRKAGCITLVMACVIAALWFRVIATGDSVAFNSTEWTGTIDGIVIGSSGPMLEVIVGVTIGAEHQWVRIVKVPNWIVAIPLTLLSAYLLLSKPRAEKPKST